MQLQQATIVFRFIVVAEHAQTILYPIVPNNALLPAEFIETVKSERERERERERGRGRGRGRGEGEGEGEGAGAGAGGAEGEGEGEGEGENAVLLLDCDAGIALVSGTSKTVQQAHCVFDDVLCSC